MKQAQKEKMRQAQKEWEKRYYKMKYKLQFKNYKGRWTTQSRVPSVKVGKKEMTSYQKEKFGNKDWRVVKVTPRVSKVRRATTKKVDWLKKIFPF